MQFFLETRKNCSLWKAIWIVTKKYWLKNKYWLKKWIEKWSSGTHVGLHYSEYIFFCVEAICKPAYAGYWSLFHSHFAAVILYLLQVFIDVRDVYCADIGAYRSVYSRLALPPHQASIYSWLPLLTGCYVPVFYGTFPFFYLPAEYILVELFCLFRICCVYLEMNYSWRNNYPLFLLRNGK